MGDRTSITDRGVESRVIDYGDRVVAQGDTAAKANGGVLAPGATPAPASTTAPPVIATISIYDPKHHLPGDVGASVVKQLTQDMNGVHQASQKADYLAVTLGLRFEVRILERMSTREERFASGKLDFPMYILHGHSNDSTSAKEIHELMLDHGIRDAGVARQLFAQAEEGWTSSTVEGLGIPRLLGFKKVGFIKGDSVAKVAKDTAAGFTNVIKHELGHMCNIVDHSRDGVMREGIMLVGGRLDYVEENLAVIIRTLTQLKVNSEAELAKAYERQNP
jgi:hypothetical protein